MPSFEILHPGLMTSIQDLGRKGLAYYAIPKSGVMDRNAARIALLLLKKGEDSPLLECTSIAPQIRFNAATRIALTGADFNWQINNSPVSLNQEIVIKKGDLLTGKATKDKLRGYIAFAGELVLQKTYNSYSTYTNAKLGGHEGRLLKKGDIIEWQDLAFDERIVPIRQGPEYNFLTEKGKFDLTNKQFKIGADSNRMGVRLLGEKIESTSYQLNNSAPVLPGFIQLPPNGLPIVVLQDGQTTGGYPRIAYIPGEKIPAFNQIPIGEEFKFVWMTEN